MGKQKLSDSDRERIFAAMRGAGAAEVVLYQTPDYNPSIRVRESRTNAVNAGNAMGDALHFLMHGITLGGMMHNAMRASNQQSNWDSLVNRVREGANQHNLACYTNSPCTQVIVTGAKYMSIYEQGEYSRREIYFKNVVQISYGKSGLRIIARTEDNKGYLSYGIQSNVGQIQGLAARSIENSMRNAA